MGYRRQHRMDLLLLFYFAYAVKISDGKPLKATESKIILGNASRQAIDDYTNLYFMPVRKATPEDVQLTYKMQVPPVREDIYNPVKGNRLVDRKNWVDLLEDASTNWITMEEQMAVSVKDKAGHVAPPSQEILQRSMERIFDTPRSTESHKENKNVVGSYITQKFVRSGLMTAEQTFKHELQLNALARLKNFPEVSNVEREGTNIVAVWPGANWLTLQDRPLVIGAHWDVVNGTSGFNDNGSGVAVLLELARVLTASECFKPEHTILFVAFDTEEAGSIGSYEFVRRVVVPFFARRGLTMTGALILDTLINYDPAPGAQTIKPAWEESMPQFVKDVKDNDYRGDFIATIRRGHPAEEHMAKVLSANLEKVKANAPADLRFQDCLLDKLTFDKFPAMNELFTYNTFWRSDHSRFWYYREQSSWQPISPSLATTTVFPAVLLTDTALFRGYMRDCYHSGCDRFSKENTTSVNYQALTKITEALALTVIELTSREPDQCRINFDRIEQQQEIEDPVHTADDVTVSKPEKVQVEMKDEEEEVAAAAEVTNQISDHFYDELMGAIDRLESTGSCRRSDGCYDEDDKATALVRKMAAFMKEVPEESQRLVSSTKAAAEDTSTRFHSGGGTQINVGSINLGGPADGYINLDSIANLIKHTYSTQLQSDAATPSNPRNSPMLIRVGV